MLQIISMRHTGVRRSRDPGEGHRHFIAVLRRPVCGAGSKTGSQCISAIRGFTSNLRGHGLGQLARAVHAAMEDELAVSVAEHVRKTGCAS